MTMSEIFSWKKIGILLGLIFIAIYPVIHGNTYIMHIFILFFIWALVASNWNLLMGYAGIFSLGNIGYFAIGGYTSGILCKTFGWSPWVCIFFGGLAWALAGRRPRPAKARIASRALRFRVRQPLAHLLKAGHMQEPDSVDLKQGRRRCVDERL